MDHINEFYELLDGIVDCAERIAKLGRLVREFAPQFIEVIPQKPVAIEAKESTKTTAIEDNAKKAAPAKKDETAYTFEDVRKAFSAKSHVGFTAEVKALISKYGAARLSDIKESDYAAIMADLEVIG
jgi:hypothetical protein